jgi:ribonucleotide reductase beta subunit family protein with ferritin-like domain
MTTARQFSGAQFEPSAFNRTSKLMTPTASYARHYPKIVELANKQLEKQFWTASEMKVELDRMQLLYELEPHQLHAVKFVLQLFLKYELIVGEEFWQGLVASLFPRPEVKLACSVMGMAELAVHAEFYNEINIQLGMDKDEDYIAYANDPVLAARVEWLEEVLSGEDKLQGMIVFGLTETALLFSNFSILRSHQANGYNKIPVIVRGTNQSAIDEDLHGMLAAEMINTHYSEIGCRLADDPVRYPRLVEAIQHVYEHECRIIDLAIPGGMLNGQSAQDYKDYVKVRINEYCRRIQVPEAFPGAASPVQDWFETQTYAYKMIDFFTPGVGMEYETSWDETGFIRGYVEALNVD